MRVVRAVVARALLGLVLAVLATGLVAAPSAGAADAVTVGLRQEVRLLHAQLRDRVGPYWLRTVDAQHGGYRLGDDGRGAPGPRDDGDKILATQARMVYAFALLHRRLPDPGGRYLAAARQGYRFLVDRMRDRVHGGYVWRTGRAGDVRDSGKILYGQAFVLLALVEYHRASRDPEPLRRARALFGLLDRRARDRVHGGFHEHLDPAWRPLPLRPDVDTPVGPQGARTDNTQMHVVVALAELVRTTRSRAAVRALRATLAATRRHLHTPRPAGYQRMVAPDGTPLAVPPDRQHDYGHAVEFAWLALRAETALRRPLGRQRTSLRRYLDHALAHGTGGGPGLATLGPRRGPATRTDRVWWVQAEYAAALATADRARRTPRYRAALLSTLRFLRERQTDPLTGIWRTAVGADGRVVDPERAAPWKDAIHDVRAMLAVRDAVLRR